MDVKNAILGPNVIAVDSDSLLRLYEPYNCQYFSGRLPTINIRVQPATKEDRGLTAEYDQASGTISFFSSGATDESLTRTRLLHEMAHVARPQDGQGAPFRTELQRLGEMGAEDAEYEVWRMVGDDAWDEGWIGEETGRWARFRKGDNG